MEEQKLQFNSPGGGPQEGSVAPKPHVHDVRGSRRLLLSGVGLSGAAATPQNDPNSINSASFHCFLFPAELRLPPLTSAC